MSFTNRHTPQSRIRGKSAAMGHLSVATVCGTMLNVGDGWVALLGLVLLGWWIWYTANEHR